MAQIEQTSSHLSDQEQQKDAQAHSVQVEIKVTEKAIFDAESRQEESEEVTARAKIESDSHERWSHD